MSEEESDRSWLDDDVDTKICSAEKIRQELFKGAQRDLPYLIVLAGDEVGKHYKLPAGETLIGRARQANLRLDDDSISRRHLMIRHSQERVELEDLSSANGTFINGLRVHHARLRDGDKIRVGETVILKFAFQDQLDEHFQQDMYEAVLRDGLTRAYNKRYFTDQLEKEVRYARRHGSELSLLMMDLDHFKQVNDTHGHPVGDEVLVELAQLIGGLVRAEDVFARYGGEEFALIARSASAVQAGVVAERIRAAVMGRLFSTLRLRITVSIGVAGFRPAMADGTELIAAADAMLYLAKGRGRNRVVLDPGPDRSA